MIKDNRNLKEISVIFILGLAVYLNSLWVNFIWDDFALVVNNPLIRDPRHFFRIFTSNLSVASDIFYRPLQNISYLADFSIYRLNHYGYHLTNILLHILVTLLFYKLLLLLSDNDRKLGFFAALLFLVCPLWVETVTYIAGRADILMAVFILLSFILFIKERIFFSTLAFLGAVFSKEASLIFPLVILAWLLIFGKRGKAFLTGFLLISGVTLAYAFVSIASRGGSLITSSTYPFQTRLLFFVKEIADYAALVFFPANLHMSYTVILPDTLFSSRMIVPVAFLALLLCMFFYYLRRVKLISFSLAWFFIMLLPQSGLFAINAFFAEHFIYLAAMGFFAVFAYYLCGMRNRRTAYAVLTAYLLLFSITTVRYNFIWQDQFKFFNRITLLSENSFAAYNNLGVLHLDRHNFSEAEKLFKKSLSINPDFPEARLNLARFYYLKNDFSRAVGLTKGVLEDYPHNYTAWNFLGTFYFKQKEYARAEDCYRKAVQINPGFGPGWVDLYNFYSAQGRDQEARKIEQRLSRVDPFALAEIFFTQSQGFVKQGDTDRALSEIDRAIKLNAGNSNYYNLKGHILKAKGDLEGAFYQFKTAIELAPRNWEAYNNLANLYALAGDFESADLYYRKALRLNGNFANLYFNLGLLYFESGRLPEAQGFFRQSLSFDATHSLAGDYLRKIKDHAK